MLVVNADGFFERPGVISKPLGHKSPHPLMQIYCRTFLLPLIQIIIMRIKKAARVSGWRVVRFWIFRLDLTRSACARTTTGGSISNRNLAGNYEWFTQQKLLDNDDSRVHPKHYSTEITSRAKLKLVSARAALIAQIIALHSPSGVSYPAPRVTPALHGPEMATP